MSTLVFHHNGIGDYLMTLPALRLIAEAAPPPLDILCGDCEAAWLYDQIPARECLRLPAGPAEFAHHIDLPQTLPQAGYDVFISLATWQSAQVIRLGRMSRARLRLGFFSSANLRPDPIPRHDIDRLFALAVPFRPLADPGDYAAPPLPARTRQGGTRLLVVHADTRREKMWPLDRYDTLLEALLGRHRDLEVRILNFDDTLIPRACRSGRARGMGRMDMQSAMALTGGADFFLGVDSCMLHVADFHRVPGLGLFGPTSPDQFGFRFSAAGRHIHAPQGLDTISVETVGAALNDLIEAAR